jgi:hypothetical protein
LLKQIRTNKPPFRASFKSLYYRITEGFEPFGSFDWLGHTRTPRLKKELNDARLEAARFEGYLIETDARLKATERRLSISLNRLSICLNELDKQEKKNQQINQS